MKTLENFLGRAKGIALTGIATASLYATTGCASYQAGVDRVFYPLHQVARQLDGESEANIFNQAAAIVSNNPEYNQAAEEVPGVVTAGDLILEPLKIYGIVKAASSSGGSSSKSSSSSGSSNPSGPHGH